MKVLHLPNNVASQISVTVRALKDLGVNARGLSLTRVHTQEGREIDQTQIPYNIYAPMGILKRIPFAKKALEAIRWADVVHWYFNTPVLPFDFDLQYVAALKKVRVVEFWGSDIRYPEIASQDNPAIAKMYQENPAWTKKAREQSLTTQKRFAKYGFECLVPDEELRAYVLNEYFPLCHMTRSRIMTSDFTPQLPDPQNVRPRVVHITSNRAFKGTKMVLETIERLKTKHNFEFNLVDTLPKFETLGVLQRCDIFINEIISGAFGIAALEAMALGKPVISHIKPSYLAKLPSGFPIIPADESTLFQVLNNLLQDGPQRHRLGRQGRAYVEKYHDGHVVAKTLINIYKQLLAKNKQR